MTLKTTDKWLLIAVFMLGSLQFIGFFAETLGASKLGRAVRGVGLVSVAAPLPLVFSAHDGLETFAQTYVITLSWGEGTKKSPTRLEIDPKLYSQASGSYNRRNIYGAVFSHGPVIAKRSGTALIDAVIRYGLCGTGPLLQAFNFSPNPVSVLMESRPNQPEREAWIHKVSCL